MPRYRVALEIQTTTGRPDENFAATVDAEDSEIAIAMVKLLALRNGCRGRVILATCNRVEEDLPVEEWVASLRYARETVASEALVFTRLSDEQAAKIAAIKSSLADGCGVRLALELALATDRAQKVPAPKAHDFGPYGDMAFCARKDCQDANKPPMNRRGCKGAA